MNKKLGYPRDALRNVHLYRKDRANQPRPCVCAFGSFLLCVLIAYAFPTIACFSTTAHATRRSMFQHTQMASTLSRKSKPARQRHLLTRFLPLPLYIPISQGFSKLIRWYCVEIGGYLLQVVTSSGVKCCFQGNVNSLARYAYSSVPHVSSMSLCHTVPLRLGCGCLWQGSGAFQLVI